MSISWESFKKIANSSYKVKIWYTDKKGDKTIRIVSPIKALEFNYNDYLEAYCHTMEADRKFIFSSITSFEILKEPREIGNLKEPEFISINNETRIYTDPSGKHSKVKYKIEKILTFTAKALLYIMFLPIIALASGGARRGYRGSGISSSFSRRAARDYYHKTKSVSSCFKSEW
ncbi:MAG: WYL domain-containing protein [Thermodesulfobacteriota bacteirum]|nr:WYL domain-containing protein [Thermodesulfobacteriota bacterium]